MLMEIPVNEFWPEMVYGRQPQARKRETLQFVVVRLNPNTLTETARFPIPQANKGEFQGSAMYSAPFIYGACLNKLIVPKTGVNIILE
jgi:hypothetical protein